MNLELKGIASFLKFFEVKYKYADIIQLEEKLQQGTTKHISVASIPMLQVFFKILLEYYKDNNFDLSFSDKDVANDIKSQLIKKIPGYENVQYEKSIALFNLVDFIFKIMKNILKKSKKGFDLWSEGKPISFKQTLSYDIDLYFYIVFRHVFPEDLLDIFKKELHISQLEDNIITKCNGIIIQQGKVCNVMKQTEIESPQTPQTPQTPKTPVSPMDSISDEESYFDFMSIKKEKLNSVDKPQGMGMVLKILSMLRGFSERRRSKML